MITVHKQWLRKKWYLFSHRWMISVCHSRHEWKVRAGNQILSNVSNARVNHLLGSRPRATLVAGMTFALVTEGLQKPHKKLLSQGHQL